MKIEAFKLERYFDKYEFKTKYLLSSSDCDGYSIRDVMQCASSEEKRQWDNLRLGYTDSRGSLFLREAIATQYKTITPDDVVVLSPGEANFILMNVLLDSVDHIVCMSPSYQSLYQIPLTIGCSVRFWKPDENWHYHPSDLETLITSQTKLLIINFPHNPTGAMPVQSEIDEIVAIARRHNLMIFSDEMYFDLVHEPHHKIPSICDIYENSICLWGMSKSFGLAGLRLGWVVSKNHSLLEEILSYKDYLTICNSPMSELLAFVALNHKENFIDANLAKIRRNIQLFSEFQSEHSDFLDFPLPQGGSTAFIPLRIRENSLDYCERLIKETGIMLLPSEMFDYGNEHVRIGFGRENMAEVLQHWGKYIMKTA